MSLEIKDVKTLSLDKRHAMLTCLSIVAGADDNKSNSELNEIFVQNELIIGLSKNDLKRGALSPKQLAKVLNTMTGEELSVLGMMMGRVAKSDGVVDEKELEWIYTLLKVGNLNVDTIAMILLGIKKAADSN
jgi:hypothetical protein